MGRFCCRKLNCTHLPPFFHLFFLNVQQTLDDGTTSEKIWKNIVTKPAKSRSKSYVVMRVGIKGGAKYADTSVNRRLGRVGQENENAGSKSNPGGDTWYWRFLEFGTSRTRAKPFLRTAFNSKKDEAEQEFIKSFKEQLNVEISRIRG